MTIIYSIKMVPLSIHHKAFLELLSSMHVPLYVSPIFSQLTLSEILPPCDSVQEGVMPCQDCDSHHDATKTTVQSQQSEFEGAPLQFLVGLDAFRRSFCCCRDPAHVDSHDVPWCTAPFCHESLPSISDDGNLTGAGSHLH